MNDEDMYRPLTGEEVREGARVSRHGNENVLSRACYSLTFTLIEPFLMLGILMVATLIKDARSW